MSAWLAIKLVAIFYAACFAVFLELCHRAHLEGSNE
jgi:hypothetical protein